MTTATDTPVINLNPDDAQQRTLSDIYRVRASGYELASDDYVARRGDGQRPLQWAIEWEGLSFRFADNPDNNPIQKRSINVVDKNGQPATWGNPNDPEPTSKDALPIQMSKLFAKCGVQLGNDPHVLDGLVFRCERRDLKAGSMTVETLVPVEFIGGSEWQFEGEPRIVQGKERGTAGNPATGAGAVAQAPAGPSKDAALGALAAAMDGKKAGDMVNIALADGTVAQNGEVLALVASGAPAVEELKRFGSFAADGTFAKAA